MLVAPAAWALAAALGGRIDEADHWARPVAAAGDRGFHNMFSTQDLLLTHAMVARERGDGDAAVDVDRAAAATSSSKPNFALRAVAEVELALVRLDQGRLDDAGDALDAALRVRSGGPLGPLVVGRVDAARSAVCVADGDVVGARRAAERMPDGLWREVALARALLAGGEAGARRAALRALAPTTPRQHVVVEMLRALAVARPRPDAARRPRGRPPLGVGRRGRHAPQRAGDRRRASPS